MKSFTTLKTLLEAADRGHYAVGGFNFCNAETAQAVLQQGVKLRSPVMLISAAAELQLCGIADTVKIVKTVAESVDVPVCLHLDHTNNYEQVCEAVDAGFSSVMLDGSHLPFEENIALTRQVVEYAQPRGVSVEGELGALGQNKDAQHEGTAQQSLTDPKEAALFVRETGVDALAVSIGNAHGMYAKRPELDFGLLAELQRLVPVPLVLHGGSGTPSDQLHRAIELGIRKVNVASEIGKAFTETFVQKMTAGGIWWAIALQDAKAAIGPVVARWMKELGSVNQV